MYDFGDHASVGYTAEEIAVLGRSPAHRDGRAYLIHAVDEDGVLSLRGATEVDLVGEESMIFRHRASPHAVASYEQIVGLAEERPLAALVKIELARHDGRDEAHAVALIYKLHAATVVSSWLIATGFAGGDSVDCGADVLAEYRADVPEAVASGYLACKMRYVSRGEDEVLASVELSVQR